MKINWGVIGCGGIAFRRTIPGLVLSENSNLVAVMDTNFDAAKTVQKQFNAKYSFDNVEELLALDEIDAVYIATPVFCHKEQVMKAAAAKKHILLEKPMGLTVADSVEIKEFCEKQGVKLGVGLMMRFNNLHEEIRNIVASGKLGEIVSMRAQFTCWYPEMEGAWRQKMALSGGGALMDMGVHCIDLLRFMSGLEAKEIVSLKGNQVFKYEVEDAASVIMKMENGALAYVDAAFNIPDEAAVCKLEIYGTGGSVFLEGSLAQDEAGEGTLVFTDSNKGYDAQQNRSRVESTKLTGNGGNLYTKEVDAFVNAILGDTEPAVTADDAIKAQKIVEAAYVSADEGKVVVL